MSVELNINYSFFTNFQIENEEGFECIVPPPMPLFVYEIIIGLYFQSHPPRLRIDGQNIGRLEKGDNIFQLEPGTHIIQVSRKKSGRRKLLICDNHKYVLHCYRAELAGKFVERILAV